jgi:peptidoglycan/xylan/chitin deacetylase (PgdA/CDA1 family)
VQFVKTPNFIKRVFPNLIWDIPNKNKEIYLSFDDSPTPEFTYWILDLLSSLNIKATFFCVGEMSDKYPEIIDAINKDGHQIGNHTYSHTNGLFSSIKSYLAEIEKCRKVLSETNLFRPTYGKIYPWQISKIQEKYKIIMWDILSYDFKKNINSTKLKSNVLNNVKSGSIIVFHDNKNSEEILKENLKDILLKLQEKGFVFGLIS